jgi:integral membrane sensor domain MASE1
MMPQAADQSRATQPLTGRYFAHVAIVFCAYFAAGKLGLATPFTSGNISPVWPAAGIALAAVLLWGYRVWPGIAAAAFLVNFLSPIPLAAAVGLATGNTLAALTGAFLLRRVSDFKHSLSRLRDVLGLIVFAALCSTVVSASIGVAVLFATNVDAWSNVGSAWLMYWLGDAMGVLLVTPLVLTLPHLSKLRASVRILELAVLFPLLTAVCFLIFTDRALFAIRLHVFAFAVFPFVVWAAIRFGVSGCSLSTLLIAGIATAETALGSGPFAQNTPFMNAVLLQVFFAVLCVSGLVVAALIVEREQLIVRQTATEGRLRLAAIVDSSDDAIIGKDMDGVVTSWNRGAERVYGYSADEVVGKPISMLMPPSVRMISQRLWRPYDAGKPSIITTLFARGRMENSSRSH